MVENLTGFKSSLMVVITNVYSAQSWIMVTLKLDTDVDITISTNLSIWNDIKLTILEILYTPIGNLHQRQIVWISDNS